ncbi:endoribonuclease L-PSP, putative [Marinitoga piezophila KA3]|uniref:Endoribonuclease L-PSP, putative n=1 Tax=Marinitoga piezophila (strain DSM 14283 / JCM 11233 / KA3) TaxID=443254 RepID=H2J4T7_MARPK|nr:MULTISPECIES: Rid family detoxifying hydrolase [Marinitoga]AEX84872.1 endoribonuclease L-PSP, putative [Marinitoga piezophila KA3]
MKFYIDVAYKLSWILTFIIGFSGVSTSSGVTGFFLFFFTLTTLILLTGTYLFSRTKDGLHTIIHYFSMIVIASAYMISMSLIKLNVYTFTVYYMLYNVLYAFILNNYFKYFEEKDHLKDLLKTLNLSYFDYFDGHQMRLKLFNNKKSVTPKNFSAVGPYSHAILKDDELFISGQLPINYETGEIPESFVEQTKQVMENIKTILKSSGFSLKDVVQVQVFLTDMSKFNEFNVVYENYFKKIYPARFVIEVSKLPKDAMVEIACIAKK